ncbi:fatty acyl-AMP ligase [Streptomyces mayteni]
MYLLRTPSFIDIVQRHSTASSRTAFSFVRNARSGTVNETLTYRNLDTAARAVAAHLIANGGPGQRVLLLFPEGLDFVKAFAGCLYAGAVAVPAPLPDRFPASIDRTAGILRDADVTTVLTDGAHRAFVGDWLAAQHMTAVACHDVGALVDDTAAAWRAPETGTGPDDLAFLQYTSGSTSEPKGVMVSHRNLLANLESIHRVIDSTPDMSAVGWLPGIHDMGLVGQFLSVLYAGGHLVFMPPNEFLRHPYRWLSLVSDVRATHTVAPNFAYELCLRRVTDEQVSALDLSSLSVVLNGAEPIRAATLDAFAERFAPAGFDPAAFSPCYGMAEATLLVSASPRLATPVTVAVDTEALAKGELTRVAPEAGDGGPSRRLVSSGRPQGCEVLIVDPEGHAVLPDGHVGEIWLRGDSVSRGYWRHDALSEETFGQPGPAPGTPDGWLRTGDLGALLDGELFVSGRLKDMVVIGGRNLYPQDMEHVVQECDGRLRGCACVVFALADGSEGVVVVQEARPTLFRADATAEVAGAIRRALAREFDVVPRAVLLTRPGTVRKTTSGKVRRSLMRQLYLDGAIDGARYEQERLPGPPRRPTGPA